MACEISVSRPGMEPMPPALGAQSLNHWTAREVPRLTSIGASRLLERAKDRDEDREKMPSRYEQYRWTFHSYSLVKEFGL